MANTKISALQVSTAPLAGVEVLPIVQGGATKQVSVAELTAGRALSATEITLSTGNLIIGTSGKGVDFSATPGAGTSELLADYEEGTWTPTITGSATNPAVVYSLRRGRYTKIGRLATLECYLEWSSLSGGSGNAQISGLPFTVDGNTGAYGAGPISQLDNVTFAAGRTSASVQPQANATTLLIYQFGSSVASASTQISQLPISGSIVFTVSYST